MRDGYYVIQSKDELQEYVGHINEEIESKKTTIKNTLEAFEAFDGEIEVEDTDEPQEKTYECAKCGSETPRSRIRWPKKGKYEDQTVCKGCHGNLIMNGEA